MSIRGGHNDRCRACPGGAGWVRCGLRAIGRAASSAGAGVSAPVAGSQLGRGGRSGARRVRGGLGITGAAQGSGRAEILAIRHRLAKGSRPDAIGVEVAGTRSILAGRDCAVRRGFVRRPAGASQCDGGTACGSESMHRAVSRGRLAAFGGSRSIGAATRDSEVSCHARQGAAAGRADGRPR